MGTDVILESVLETDSIFRTSSGLEIISNFWTRICEVKRRSQRPIRIFKKMKWFQVVVMSVDHEPNAIKLNVRLSGHDTD